MAHQDIRQVQDAAGIAGNLASITTLQGKRVRKASLAVGFADLVAAALLQELPFAAALPAGAVVLETGIDISAGFTDGVAGVFTADLGINTGDVDAFVDGSDIASIAKVSSPKGVRPGGLVGAVTPSITVRGDVNVGTATAGALIAEIYYIDGAALD